MSEPLRITNPEPLREIQLIPLRNAYICFNCETIGNDSRLCFACGSTFAIRNLDKFIACIAEDTSHQEA